MLADPHPGEERLAPGGIALGEVVEGDLAVVAQHVVGHDGETADQVAAPEGEVRGVGDAHVHADAVVEPVLAVARGLGLEPRRAGDGRAQLLLGGADPLLPVAEAGRQLHLVAERIVEQLHPQPPVVHLPEDLVDEDEVGRQPSRSRRRRGRAPSGALR